MVAIFSFIYFVFVMTDMMFMYVFVGILFVLVVFCFAMGLEKMIKLLLGNYLLILLILATNQSLVLLMDFLQKTPTLVFAWFTFGSIASFLLQWKMTFMLLLYLGFFFLIYYKSKIRIVLPMDDIVQKILYIALVPLTVVWIIFALVIVFLGTSLFDPAALLNLATQLPQNPIISQAVYLMPVWIFIHALCTILLTSEIKIQIKTGD